MGSNYGSLKRGHWAAGIEVLAQGDKPAEMYVIAFGICGVFVRNRDGLEQARRLVASGAPRVLLKGGHLAPNQPTVDVLVTPTGETVLSTREDQDREHARDGLHTVLRDRRAATATHQLGSCDQRREEVPDPRNRDC